MSNASYTNRKLNLVFSQDFVIQTAFDEATDPAFLDGRHPQNTPTFHNLIPFREETRDCSGEYVVIERLTGKIARFSFAFDFTPKLAAGWFAYLKGVAAAPTGAPADEVQSIALGGATAGDARFSLDFEGVTGYGGSVTTDATLTAAEVQTALEAARGIGAGNVAVTGSAGGPFAVTFQNELAKANLPLLTVDDNSTGGTGVVVTQTTAGANKLHAITGQESEALPNFSMIEGFPDDANSAREYKNLVMADWTVNTPSRGKGVLTIVAYGNPDPIVVNDFDWPDCITQAPIRSSDVRMKIGSTWLGSDIREITLTESNNVDVSEDALLYDGLTPDQLEHGDRTSSINVLVKGTPAAALYEFAEDADNAFDDTEIHFGRPGERLSWYAPNVQFRLDDNLIEFTGTRNKSAFRLLGRPSPDNTGVVSRADYIGSYTGTFLTDGTP